MEALGARARLPLVMLLAAVVQAVLLGHARVAGVAPDVLLLVAASAGIVGGPARGAVVGFFAGLVVDVLFLETPLGLSALAFSVVGYVVGLAQAGVLRAAWWIPVLITMVASAAGEALFALAGAVVGQGQLVTHRLWLIALVVGLLNAVLSPAAVPLMRWSMRPTGPQSRYAL